MKQNAEEILELEEQNFRVDSTDWKKVWAGWFGRNSYLTNPENNIFEFVYGKYKGEQLFTWDAAVKWTRKFGKKIPCIECLEKAGPKLNIIPAGRYCCEFDGENISYNFFKDQGACAYFWSNSDYSKPVYGGCSGREFCWYDHSKNAAGLKINLSDKIIEYSSIYKGYAQSVRCCSSACLGCCVKR